ncbi:MAG TPA: hypothetical protein VL461_09600 [Dictyobacter sp.]|jgi:hypothetical protein|nr:hypothetical protein [Dictyobacter sp.]
MPQSSKPSFEQAYPKERIKAPGEPATNDILRSIRDNHFPTSSNAEIPPILQEVEAHTIHDMHELASLSEQKTEQREQIQHITTKLAQIITEIDAAKGEESRNRQKVIDSIQQLNTEYQLSIPDELNQYTLDAMKQTLQKLGKEGSQARKEEKRARNAQHVVKTLREYQSTEMIDIIESHGDNPQIALDARRIEQDAQTDRVNNQRMTGWQTLHRAQVEQLQIEQQAQDHLATVLSVQETTSQPIPEPLNNLWEELNKLSPGQEIVSATIDQQSKHYWKQIAKLGKGSLPGASPELSAALQDLYFQAVPMSQRDYQAWLRSDKAARRAGIKETQEQIFSRAYHHREQEAKSIVHEAHQTHDSRTVRTQKGRRAFQVLQAIHEHKIAQEQALKASKKQKEISQALDGREQQLQALEQQTEQVFGHFTAKLQQTHKEWETSTNKDLERQKSELQQTTNDLQAIHHQYTNNQKDIQRNKKAIQQIEDELKKAQDTIEVEINSILKKYQQNQKALDIRYQNSNNNNNTYIKKITKFRDGTKEHLDIILQEQEMRQRAKLMPEMETETENEVMIASIADHNLGAEHVNEIFHAKMQPLMQQIENYYKSHNLKRRTVDVWSNENISHAGGMLKQLIDYDEQRLSIVRRIMARTTKEYTQKSKELDQDRQQKIQTNKNIQKQEEIIQEKQISLTKLKEKLTIFTQKKASISSRRKTVEEKKEQQEMNLREKSLEAQNIKASTKIYFDVLRDEMRKYL